MDRNAFACEVGGFETRLVSTNAIIITAFTGTVAERDCLRLQRTMPGLTTSTKSDLLIGWLS